MDVVLLWAFVYTLHSNIILFTSGFGIKVGHFKVLRQHRDLRKCADAILRQNKFVGGRISDLTGDCEGLSHSWGREKVVAYGYGYFRNINVQDSFQPAILNEEKFVSNIPVVLNTGAKIHMYLRWPEPNKETYFILRERIAFEDRFNGSSFEMRIIGNGNDVDGSQTAPGHMSRLDSVTIDGGFFGKTGQCKISLVKQRNFIQLLGNDELIKTWKITFARFSYMRILALWPDPRAPVLVRRLEFTEV